MLESHLNAIEKVLLAQGEVSSNAGHPNLIGGPKEWFVRNFLADHLPSAVRIGQGEIIDSRSEKFSKRNQVDVILYRYDFPKIVYSKNDCAFLRESVIATIEVKSVANKGEFRKACEASISHKNIQYIQEPDPKKPSQPIGVIINIADLAFPAMSSYVVAFDGPAKISTAASWLPAMSLEFETTPDKLADMIVILGKGVVWRIESFPLFGKRFLQSEYPNATWAFIEQKDKNLLLLFLHMLSHMTVSSQIPIDYFRYARNVSFNRISAL